MDQVLKSLGNPAALARRYRDGESYVVGPENYDTYLLVLKIVLISVLIGFVVSAVVGLLADGNAGSFKDGARFFGARSPKDSCPSSPLSVSSPSFSP